MAGMVTAIPGALASGTFAAVAGLSRLSIFGYTALGAAGTATLGLSHLDLQRGHDRWPLYFYSALVLGYGFLVDLQLCGAVSDEIAAFDSLVITLAVAGCIMSELSYSRGHLFGQQNDPVRRQWAY